LTFYPNDTQLWQAFCAGDEQAFEIIYKRHFSSLLRYGRTLVHNDDLVRDAIQDVFIDLHKYRSSLKGVDTILPYLFRSLKNLLTKRIVAVQDNETLLDSKLVEASVEDVLLLQELSQSQSDALQKALDGLPSRQREAIHLKFYENLSNQEIADLMGVNYQSVVNFVQRGLSQLSTSIVLIKHLKRLYSFFF
jgi:RNA polymerase sigma factor (sigma-70 family)